MSAARLLDEQLYELGRHAGRSAGRLPVNAAAQVRDSAIDARCPAQMRGWCDGLAETRPVAAEWPLPYIEPLLEVAA